MSRKGKGGAGEARGPEAGCAEPASEETPSGGGWEAIKLGQWRHDQSGDLAAYNANHPISTHHSTRLPHPQAHGETLGGSEGTAVASSVSAEWKGVTVFRQ